MGWLWLPFFGENRGFSKEKQGLNADPDFLTQVWQKAKNLWAAKGEKSSWPPRA
jgi:hypothetical protein